MSPCMVPGPFTPRRALSGRHRIGRPALPIGAVLKATAVVQSMKVSMIQAKRAPEPAIPRPTCTTRGRPPGRSVQLVSFRTSRRNILYNSPRAGRRSARVGAFKSSETGPRPADEQSCGLSPHPPRPALFGRKELYNSSGRSVQLASRRGGDLPAWKRSRARKPGRDQRTNNPVGSAWICTSRPTRKTGVGLGGCVGRGLYGTKRRQGRRIFPATARTSYAHT